MIEKLKLTQEEPPVEATAFAWEMTVVSQKINEIIDHLNTVHGKGRHHVSPSMEPEFKVWIGAKPHPEG